MFIIRLPCIGRDLAHDVGGLTNIDPVIRGMDILNPEAFPMDYFDLFDVNVMFSLLGPVDVGVRVTGSLAVEEDVRPRQHLLVHGPGNKLRRL